VLIELVIGSESENLFSIHAKITSLIQACFIAPDLAQTKAERLDLLL
jgi:hypothetical protein